MTRFLKSYTLEQVQHCQRSPLSRQAYCEKYGFTPNQVKYIRSLNLENLEQGKHGHLADEVVISILNDLNQPGANQLLIGRKHQVSRLTVMRIAHGETYKRVREAFFGRSKASRITDKILMSKPWTREAWNIHR